MTFSTERLRELSKSVAPSEMHRACGWAADEVERLRSALKKANDQAERFEREWYLRGDVLEEAIAWSASEQGRAIPQVDGQPGVWINKARDLMGPNAEVTGVPALSARPVD